MSLRDLHAVLGWIVVAANGAVGLWALAAHQWIGLRHRSLWIATAVAQFLVLVQIVIGVVDMQSRGVEVGGVHLFYGFIALIWIGIVYSYRQQIERWQYLWYGAGGLFLMGLALRSIFIPALGG